MGETVLRVYNAVAHSHIFYDGSYNQYRGKPHVTLYGYRLNAGGFNDTEFTAQPGDYRIVGLGDSFAFGIVPLEKERLDSRMYRVPENGQQPGGNAGLFNQTINALLRTRDYCQAQGAQFIVAIIPNELQVDAPLKHDLVRTYYAKAGKLPYDLLTPTRRLAQRLRDNHILYIDLYETFRKAVPTQQLDKPSDSHWNIVGNAFAAQLLADSLAKVIPGDA